MSKNSKNTLDEIAKLTTKLQKLNVQQRKLREQEQDCINKIQQLATRTSRTTSYQRFDCNDRLIRIGDKVEINTDGRNRSTSGTVIGHDSRFVLISGNYVNPNTGKRETVKRESQNLTVL